MFFSVFSLKKICVIISLRFYLLIFLLLCLQGVVRVQLEMQMANTVCEVAVASGAGAVGPLPAAPPAAQCYDRDKQVNIIFKIYMGTKYQMYLYSVSMWIG